MTFEHIGSTLERHAARKPEEVAIVCNSATISWERLLQLVAHRSVWIRSQAGSNPRVCIDTRSPTDLIIWVLATARGGGEAHILDPDWPSAVKNELIRKLAPSLIVSSEFPQMAPAPLQTKELNGPATADDPFYVGFTSGVAAAPKGFRRSHLSWIESFRAEEREFGIQEGDIVAAIGSVSHSLFLYAALRSIQIGARTILMNRFDPNHALDIMDRKQATILYAAPSHLKLMEIASAQTVNSLRLVLCSGSKWLGHSERLSSFFPNAEFSEFYGASELSFVSVRRKRDGAPSSSVGRAFPGVEIAIRDQEGRKLQAGAVGRIYVRSPFLFNGYATGEAPPHRHGDEMSIGDLGRLDENGFLYLEGREGRMLVTSGKNVFPEQLEAILMEHPHVEAAAVIGVDDPKRGVRLVGLIIPKESAELSAASLILHLKQKVSPSLIPTIYMQPRQWRWTRSGKTDIGALEDDLREGACELIR